MARKLRNLARPLLTVIVPSILVACDSTTGPDGLIPPPVERTARFLRITVLDEAVSAGGTARLRLQNLSSRGIGYNLCIDRQVERWTGERWVREEIEERGICPAVLALLAPGSDVILEHLVPHELGPGIHRFDFRGIVFLE